jgi:protoporphyrinogen oxidase/MoaA/NifB/PqqE/SkfB family radical SAM enzyme
MQASPYVIVGGGIAGLTCAVRLAEAGRPCLVLERAERVGGLLRSEVLDGVVFDYGPHVLFLDGPGAGEAFLRDVLAGRPVIRHPFAFAVAAGGRLWQFPNHLDFFRYPLRYKLEAVRAALTRRGAPPPEPISAELELSEKCGPALYDLLFRQLFTKKALMSPAALHHHWLARVDRTIDNAKEPFVRRGKAAAVLSAIAKLRQRYWYPAGGLGDVPALLRRRIEAAGGEIVTGVQDVALTREGDRIASVVADGRSITPAQVVWTAPLESLNAALGSTTPPLPSVTMRLVMLTYARTERTKRPFVYTYHPDPALQANRIYYPESIYRERGPADREGLCLEINLEDAAEPEEHTLDRAITDVARLGLYPVSALRASKVVTLPSAMPVYPLDYEARLAAAVAPVRAVANLHAVGRQGGFYFCLTPAAAGQGLKMADHLLGVAKPAAPLGKAKRPGLLDAGLATKGAGAAERVKILKRHAQAFVRHATVKRLLNFSKAERNRLQKRAVLDSMPYILKIETTNICNLRCAYCYDDRRAPAPGERPYGRMTVPQFRGLIDSCGDYLFKINMYGFGEPFLFPETLEMIRYATDKNIGVGVSSNLNHQDPDLPRRIVASGLEVLIFSCHGVSFGTAGRFMRGGNADLAFANLRALVAARTKAGSKTPYIDWQYCVTGFNEHEIEKARETAARLGVDQVRFIRPFFPANAPDEWFSTMFPRQTLTHDHEAAPGCSWLYRSAYINWDGGLIPCCRDPRDPAVDFGNVFETPLPTLWNSEKYQAARTLLADPSRHDLRKGIVCGRCPVTRGA